MRRFATLALASALSLAVSAAAAQTLTITEVDHVGNRITVSGPGVEKRIVDLDDAVISGPDVPRMAVGDLQAGDRVVVDGTLRGPRLTARSVQVVPPAPPGGRGALPAPDPGPTTPERVPAGPREPSAMDPGAPLPAPSPGAGALPAP